MYLEPGPPLGAGAPQAVFATQARNAVIDMAVYGTIAVLALERNGNGKKAEA